MMNASMQTTQRAFSREARSGKNPRHTCIERWREHLGLWADAMGRGDMAEAQKHHELAGDWAEASRTALFLGR